MAELLCVEHTPLYAEQESQATKSSETHHGLSHLCAAILCGLLVYDMISVISRVRSCSRKVRSSCSRWDAKLIESISLTRTAVVVAQSAIRSHDRSISTPESGKPHSKSRSPWTVTAVDVDKLLEPLLESLSSRLFIFDLGCRAARPFWGLGADYPDSNSHAPGTPQNHKLGCFVCLWSFLR